MVVPKNISSSPSPYVSISSFCCMVQNCCPRWIVMKLSLIINFGTYRLLTTWLSRGVQVAALRPPLTPMVSLCVFSSTPNLLQSLEQKCGADWKALCTVLGHCSSLLNLHLCNSPSPCSLEEIFLKNVCMNYMSCKNKTTKKWAPVVCFIANNAEIINHPWVWTLGIHCIGMGVIMTRFLRDSLSSQLKPPFDVTLKNICRYG